MAIRIEAQDQLKEIKKNNGLIARYIYFDLPTELWLGGNLEGHASILDRSTRKLEEVAVDGFIFYMDEPDIDGNGSETLGIKSSDPTLVKQHVASLPKSK